MTTLGMALQERFERAGSWDEEYDICIEALDYVRELEQENHNLRSRLSAVSENDGVVHEHD